MTQLSTLKNIGKETQVKLESIGISSAEELREIGSREAYIKLKEVYPQMCIVHLYALEGAVKGIAFNALEEENKNQLKLFCKSLDAGIPCRQVAEKLLEEAFECNVGPWADHSRNVALCAEKIARAGNMDGDKAYVLGLLHDIGRKFGVKHLGHVYDGYKYMLELGYTQVARICLTHSFGIKELRSYIGNFDISRDKQKELESTLKRIEYDDYDRLIQLCDAMGAAEGIVDICARMQDVKERYGSYPKDKWDKNLELKEYFENLTKKDLYSIVGK